MYFKGVLNVIIFISFFCVAILQSCSPIVKPNTPFAGPYPDSLSKLFNKSQLLATELCKLPEIQNGISNDDNETLKKLLDLYNDNPNLFISVFREMYSTGKPEIRKYCTPLQALFWLIEDNRYSDFKSLFENYTIDRLLNLSWNFEKENLLSTEQIETILEGTKNLIIKTEYLDTYKKYGASKIEKHILFDFNRKPSWFSSKARKILKEAHNKKFEKWIDFYEVTERLNSPEIINHYEIRQIEYQYWNTIPGAVPDKPDIYYVFRNKRGDCEYISAFTVYCLKKAGYDAYLWRMPVPHSKWGWHAVAVYFDKGIKMVLDNGRPTPHKVGIVPYCVFQKE